ncbi:hypothetical protein QYF36_001598 [Acer negundo]|nr:hypothetical protein QYF36_001598 [Acer negundo]
MSLHQNQKAIQSGRREAPISSPHGSGHPLSKERRGKREREGDHGRRSIAAVRSMCGGWGDLMGLEWWWWKFYYKAHESVAN